ncbi:MAG: cell division protein FtsB [Gammaproteobacteria bacterium]|nr:cell division protein FtsB [Gammaproteobacteria bacterium]
MRLLVGILSAVLLLLQYALWVGDGGVREMWQLKRAVETQRGENARLEERNRVLAAEVRDLKQGLAAVEARARKELGMIKDDETFFQVIDGPADSAR